MSRILAAAVLLALAATPVFSEVITRPNSVKYSDTGLPNAKGSADGATIEARVLVNRDDSTTVEITTGSFDEPLAGEIRKVQIKGTGETLNFNDTEGSTFATTIAGGYPGALLQIDAHVKGIGGGTTVIQVTETAKLRPDLAVGGVIAPVHTWIGFPTRISASVSELNGDVGARANCRLLVDGVEVDRAEGIWVDAGDTVQCSFAYAFEAAGDAALQVVVDGVNPGDWDDANNSASGTTTVYADDAAFVNWTARVTETIHNSYRYNWTTWFELTRYESGPSREISFDGNIVRNVDLDNVAVSARAETDGIVLHDTPSLNFPMPPFTRGPSIRQQRCRASENGPVRATLCYDLPGRFKRNDYTNVQIELGASDITYRSWGYNKELAPQNPGDPYYIFDEYRAPEGDFIPLATTLSLDVQVSDGTELWRATPFISSFTTSETHVDSPYRCFTSPFYGETCQETRIDDITRSGTASN